MSFHRIAAAVALAILAGHATAADLTVVFDDVAPHGGNVRAALFKSATDFPKTLFLGQEVPSTGTSVTVVFKDVAAGDYAVSGFQDVNGNQKLDRNLFGLPLEPYGFSNGVRGGPGGPPSFSDAAFHVGDQALTVKVKLK